MKLLTPQSLLQIDEELKLRLIHLMLILESVVSVITLVMSCFRAAEIGFSPRDMVQMTLVCILLLVTVSRHQLSISSQFIFLLVFNFIVLNAGLLTLGPLAGSVFFLFLTCFMVALCGNRRWLYGFFLFSTAYLVLVAYLITSQTVVMNNNIHRLLYNVPHWAVYITCLLLVLMISGISLISYRERTQSLLKQMVQQNKDIAWFAEHDQLTGLKNFRALQRHAQLIEADLSSALLFIDLDGFKAVNDSYGHDAGDECLRQVARRLTQIFGEFGVCCRHGGDEFLVLVSAPQGLMLLAPLAQKCLNSLAQPIEFEQRRLQVGASIGIAINKHNQLPLEALRRQADAAMYQAKKRGKGCFVNHGVETSNCAMSDAQASPCKQNQAA
ncbi:diguanylate cyclase domain-containing protein [Motilimonas pumila]|uniref:GGDEF domain-containing protein n=1 Tax=Motilimonas pumila TaxID=2303987 RepID=A0A418YBW8_9GAMM|nr:diguanylate cyclase [Motilimonas pumila]RJG42023.1 GGDEF domain-containing protein [Motilimonas pumila]